MQSNSSQVTQISTAVERSSSAVPDPAADLNFTKGPFPDRLQHLEQLASVGTLSASFAHEIKNALVAVRTFLDLLLEQNKNADLVTIVQREILRIDAIVTQMLRLAAPAKPSLAPVRMNELVRGVLLVIEPQLKGRSISSAQNLGAQHDTIHGDYRQLEQALMNLLLNALDALDGKGTLGVATSVLPARKRTRKGTPAVAKIHITIRDTGCGISSEQLSHLFEPFFTTKPNGTGLGLVITKQIIEQHGGEISVESDLGTGTTFHILLPLHPYQKP
jgi:signal transduction histidine kinase